MTSGMMMSTTLYLLLDLSSWHMGTGVVTSRSLGVGAGPRAARGVGPAPLQLVLQCNVIQRSSAPDVGTDLDDEDSIKSQAESKCRGEVPAVEANWREHMRQQYTTWHSMLACAPGRWNLILSPAPAEGAKIEPSPQVSKSPSLQVSGKEAAAAPPRSSIDGFVSSTPSSIRIKNNSIRPACAQSTSHESQHTGSLVHQQSMPELGPVDKYSSWRYDAHDFMHTYAIIHVLPTQVPGRSSRMLRLPQIRASGIQMKGATPK
ncbi:hypothetical protein X797_000768 [Metarhizium robertsii]|uniref:Uncharacterized protein n=1 Tax=Metarhizium robertsii TaxID=568076 RepID=A0A0A1V877_9HYPO|nr:hypothetical protein X797_000768 [Metarhizium robertsii]